MFRCLCLCYMGSECLCYLDSCFAPSLILCFALILPTLPLYVALRLFVSLSVWLSLLVDCSVSKPVYSSVRLSLSPFQIFLRLFFFILTSPTLDVSVCMFMSVTLSVCFPSIYSAGHRLSTFILSMYLYIYLFAICQFVSLSV